MNQFLKALCLIAFITFFAACKKDDDVSITPPRDFAVQYNSEKDSIVKYLKTHYIVNVDAEYNISFDSIRNTNHVSIWDQTDFPLQKKEMVRSTNTENLVDYTLYYLVLNQGVGNQPSRADDVLIAYRGLLLNDTQFDYNPFPQTPFSLYYDVAVEGWRELLPLFKAGVFTDVPGDPNPARFENYGAGVMFIPSGMAYYNQSQGLIPAYNSLIFSFKLYAVNYTDIDADGILNKDEIYPPFTDIQDVDTDGDGTPNYLDIDDDGDGYVTKRERLKYDYTDPANPVPFNPAQYYEFADIPTCTGGTLPRHLDPNCFR